MLKYDPEAIVPTIQPWVAQCGDRETEKTQVPRCSGQEETGKQQEHNVMVFSRRKYKVL